MCSLFLVLRLLITTAVRFIKENHQRLLLWEVSVVQQRPSEFDPITSNQRPVTEHAPQKERADVQGLIVAEMRRLHEGVLVSYGLRPFEYAAWTAWHGR